MAKPVSTISVVPGFAGTDTLFDGNSKGKKKFQVIFWLDNDLCSGWRFHTVRKISIQIECQAVSEAKSNLMLNFFLLLHWGSLFGGSSSQWLDELPELARQSSNSEQQM